MLSDLFNEEYISTSNDERESHIKLIESFEKCKLLTPGNVCGRNYRDKRPIVRPNYIPFPTSTRSSREEWSFTYYIQIEELYKIFIDIINKKFPKNKIKWYKDSIKYGFETLIYHCSSKYIDKLV